MPEYFSFCQNLVVGLLSSHLIEHKALGQDMLHTTIQSICATRPLMSTFIVTSVWIPPKTKVTRSFQEYPQGTKDRRNLRTNQLCCSLTHLQTPDHYVPTWCLSKEHEDLRGEFEYTDLYTYEWNSSNHPTSSTGWVALDECYLPAPILAANLKWSQSETNKRLSSKT